MELDEVSRNDNRHNCALLGNSEILDSELSQWILLVNWQKARGNGVDTRTFLDNS